MRVYIQFTSPKGKVFPVFSWAIRAFERTPYSHVRLFWRSKSGEQLIYEASGASVRLIGRHAAVDNQVHIHHEYAFDLSPEQYRRMISLFRFASVKYGFWQILGIVLARWLKLDYNPTSSGTRTQVCSELIGLFLDHVLDWEIGTDLDTATPRDLKEYLDTKLIPEKANK